MNTKALKLVVTLLCSNKITTEEAETLLGYTAPLTYDEPVPLWHNNTYRVTKNDRMCTTLPQISY